MQSSIARTDVKEPIALGMTPDELLGAILQRRGKRTSIFSYYARNCSRLWLLAVVFSWQVIENPVLALNRSIDTVQSRLSCRHELPEVNPVFFYSFLQNFDCSKSSASCLSHSVDRFRISLNPLGVGIYPLP